MCHSIQVTWPEFQSSCQRSLAGRPMGTPVACWMEPPQGGTSQLGTSLPSSAISVFRLVAWNSKSAYAMGRNWQMPYIGVLLRSESQLLKFVSTRLMSNNYFSRQYGVHRGAFISYVVMMLGTIYREEELKTWDIPPGDVQIWYL